MYSTFYVCKYVIISYDVLNLIYLYKENEDYERDFKTTSEHWCIILNYPMLLKSKFGGFDGDNSKMKELWEEMVNILNSLGYGQRSVQKWKEAIGRWKSKVKAKAKRQRQEITATGGGPMKAVPLTQTEEKLMAIIGWKAVTGDSNKELGIVTTNNQSPNKIAAVPSFTSVHPCTSTEIVTPKIPSVFSNPSTTAPKSLDATLLIEPPPLTLLKRQTASRNKEGPLLSVPSNKLTESDKEESPLPVLSNKRTLHGDKENCSFMQNKKKNITMSDKNERYVTLTTMHREQIDVLNNINLNIKNVSDNLRQIASNINQLTNYFITNEKTDNEFESIEFLEDDFNATE